MTQNLDEITLTPTEELIMELLQARYRLGENSWSFMNRHMKALNSLEDRGLIAHKSAPVEGARLVWLTDLGYEFLFSREYHVLIDSKKLQKRQKDLRKRAKRNKKRREEAGDNG